jgi:cyclase
MPRMRRIRVIPTLLVKDGALVKTRRFRDPVYVGDPINAVRIFNDKGADELVLLDIGAAGTGRPMPIAQLSEIVSEAFMPVAYGGGITSVEDVERILGAGVEKVVLNSAVVHRPKVLEEAAKRFGSQAVVGSIDVRRRLLGGYRVYIHGARKRTALHPAIHARRLEDLGAGEIIITSVDHEGEMGGYDLSLVRAVAEATTVPVIANGGAATIADFVSAVREGGASAVAAGSMFVFQGRHRAVLINYPAEALLREQLFARLQGGDRAAD